MRRWPLWQLAAEEEEEAREVVESVDNVDDCAPEWLAAAVATAAAVGKAEHAKLPLCVGADGEGQSISSQSCEKALEGQQPPQASPSPASHPLGLLFATSCSDVTSNASATNASAPAVPIVSTEAHIEVVGHSADTNGSDAYTTIESDGDADYADIAVSAMHVVPSRVPLAPVPVPTLAVAAPSALGHFSASADSIDVEEAVEWEEMVPFSTKAPPQQQLQLSEAPNNRRHHQEQQLTAAAAVDFFVAGGDCGGSEIHVNGEADIRSPLRVQSFGHRRPSASPSSSAVSLEDRCASAEHSSEDSDDDDEDRVEVLDSGDEFFDESEAHNMYGSTSRLRRADEHRSPADAAASHSSASSTCSRVGAAEDDYF